MSEEITGDPNSGRWGRRLLIWFSAGPGWQFNLAVGLVFLVSLIGISVPGGDFWLLIYCIPFWLILGIVWLFRIFTAALIHWYYPQLRGRIGSGKQWLVAPVMVVALVLLSRAQIPVTVRFWLSKPSLEQMAHQVMENSANMPAPETWIGLYKIRRVEAEPWGVSFSTYGGFMLDDNSFVYVKGGGFPAREYEWKIRLSRDWWLTHVD